MIKKQKKGKVFVGMSGGVDSSVAAALLREEGYAVTGVFIKIADFSEEWGVKCTWREERREAMRAAAHLDIPLVTIDLSKEYRELVVDYMIKEYRTGRTPNPDVMCNSEIKFGAFFEWARKQGADYVATGHYVKLGKGGELLKAFDPAKDQSYFLWTLTQDQLQHCLFPIGEHKKEAVRKLAKKFGLPNAEKKDSQGLCFIGHLAIKDFLKKFIPEKVGEVFNEQGEKIGTHQGAVFYTIGERHGFTITQKTPSDKPYYVVGKDIKKNLLMVGHQHHNLDTSCPREFGGLGHEVSKLSEVNWISGTVPDLSKTYQAQIRYHGELYKCQIKSVDQQNKTAELEFLDAPQALTPGQSCVIYNKDEMLGGGIIS